MGVCPPTSATLLQNLASDSQHARWGEFVARYRPMMAAFMQSHFPTLDADEAIQQTLIALIRIFPVYHYVPDERGSFHNYLTGILRHKALKLRAAENRMLEQRRALSRAALSGASSGASLSRATSSGVSPDVSLSRAALAKEPYPPSAAPPRAAEEEAWRAAVFEIALQQYLADDTVQPRTKQVFARLSLNGEKPEAVAAAFGLTRNAVDQIRSRAMTRLRALVKALEQVDDARFEHN